MSMGLRMGLSLTGPAAVPSGPFDPAALNPTAWYDPSDTATVFTDLAGTAQAVNGSLVRRINDKSGNGNHLLVAGDATRPTLVQAGALWYLDFDGNDTMADAFAAAIPQPTFISLALKADATAATQAPLDNHSAGSGDRQHINMVSGNWGMFATSSTLTIGAASAVNAQVVSANFNGASSVGYLNGVAGATGNPGAAASGGLTLGTANDGVSAPYAGLFYGLIMLPRTPSASERANIHTYLGAKAGLTI